MSEGLRKRRTHHFVQVPRDTIRDRRLSYRARGLLTYLLDMPDGWDVRSDALAREGKEGREAVRTALKELSEHGYYRLERRTMSDGRKIMGTAISEAPVPQWVDESVEWEGAAVPVVEQGDGSFKVRHKDGSFTDDGFEPADKGPQPERPTDPDDDPDSAETSPDTSTGDGFPGPGNPDSGNSGVGKLGPSMREDKGDHQGTTAPADAVAEPQQPEATVHPLPDPVERDRRAQAETITRAWHDNYVERNGAIVNWRHIAVRNMVEGALKAGYHENAIKRALLGLDVPLPGSGQWQAALVEVSNGREVRGHAGPARTSHRPVHTEDNSAGRERGW